MGFGHPAISISHNKTRKPGDHCARIRGMRRIGWSKRVSAPNCTLSVIIFIFVIKHHRRAAFYKPPPAVVCPFRVVFVK